MSTKYEITVSLPSNGKLYEDIPSEFVLRAMTTAEEKLILGSSGDDVFDRVLKACIVEPKNIDLGKLISADKHFLILKLRIHTYGSLYNVVGECPSCKGKTELEINLDEFPIHELDSTFIEPIEMTLPVCGDKVSCKLLRDDDLSFVSRQARKLSKALKVPVRELTYSMRMARYIKKLNGKDIDDGEAQKYISDMHGRDSAYFWFRLNEVLIGYDTTIEAECGECGESLEFIMPINSEFFRPKFR